MVSPAAKLLDSESEGAVPDRAVAPVIGAGGDAWLFLTAPIAMLSVLKKLSPAATADAAASDVLASVPIALLSEALRLAAVAAGVVPMAKLLAAGGVVLLAVNCTVWVVPSGRLKVKLI